MISENVVYVIARLAAATLRPFTLLVLGKVLAGENLALYAIFLLIIGIGILLCGADPHRVYYDRYFKGLKNVAFHFSDYLTKLAILFFWGALVTFVAGIAYGLSVSLIGLAIICFLIEKSFDEIQRFCLFEQNFSKWSRIILVRVSLNHIAIALLGFAHFRLGVTISLPLFLSVITLASAVSLTSAWTRADGSLLALLSYCRIIVHRVKRSLRSFHLILWDLTRVSSLGAVNHLDRVIVGFVDTTVLASMTLLNMCFGFVQQAVDMFFTSRVRGDLLRADIRVSSLFFNRSLSLAIAAGVCAGFLAMYASRFVAGGRFDYSLEFVTFYLFLHVTISLTAIFQQMVYWGSGLQRSFVIELMFLGLLGALTGMLMFAYSSVFGYLGALATAVGIRALIYAIHASRQEGLRKGSISATKTKSS